MNKFGIVIHPLVPLRAEASELSEMTTQLLFGERIKVLEQTNKWIFLENIADDYQGWADAKMIQFISEETFIALDSAHKIRLENTINSIYNKDNESKLIPAGSIIYDIDSEIFTTNKESWCLDDSFSFSTEKYHAQNIISLAKKFLYAPYLWGGKSILGIDCSGLTQLVFTIGGYFLPRNASQQIHLGEQIDFLSEAQAGDLAFFGDDDGRITHVGILLDNERILHASGWVKIERIDPYGIISSTIGQYSHQLKAIKRIIS